MRLKDQHGHWLYYLMLLGCYLYLTFILIEAGFKIDDAMVWVLVISFAVVVTLGAVLILMLGFKRAMTLMKLSLKEQYQPLIDLYQALRRK